MFGIISLKGFALSALDVSAIQTKALKSAAHYQKDAEILKQLFLEKSHENLNKASSNKESTQEHLAKHGRVLVFLSFSMPSQSIEEWLLQCKRSGATPIIRGLQDNSFQKTLQTIRYFADKTHTGMQIDPILFKTFDIDKVPAVVYVKNPTCAKNPDCAEVDFDSIYGDISLLYALSKIEMNLKESHPELLSVITKLKRGAV
ncbi:MAG: type-F conjugative transfer system pilin assembly protein TrbC [Gammaproteobacteria bacterium]|nr:type-F conjugative transfer system pilin assembly protein TrbC [Gammaproteobacteria bacterium]